MEKYPRYKRDQLAVLQKAALEYPTVIDEALQKCMSETLMSANDFTDVAKYAGCPSERDAACSTRASGPIGLR